MQKNVLLAKTIGRTEFDHPLLWGVLKQLGYAAPTKKIHDLKKAGVIVGIKKGLYVFPEDYAQEAVSKETLANLIYGPSYLSLEYALSYHGFIPERVETLTSVTPKRDKLFHTPVGTFSYRHLAISKYREGVELLWLSPKRSVFMASPEKALIDYIVLNKVSVPKSVDSAKIFLEEDLRIDSESWKRFNVSLINRLNRVYKCKAVDVVAQVFERIKP